MVEIKIKYKGKYFTLEVGSKELIRFTYQRYAFTDIQSFLSSFSQSIELEGNNNNISVLENITSLDIYRDLTDLENEVFINKKFDCIYIINDYQFDGLLTIESVYKNKGNGSVSINCNIRSLEVAVSELLGDKLLRSENGDIEDLNMDDLKHTFNVENVKNTWTDYEGQDYYYPLINYNNTKVPQIDLSTLRPAIKAKYLVDKIFDSIGFEYESVFMNSTEFKDIIHPWVNMASKSNEDVEIRKFNVGLNSNTIKYYAEANTYSNRPTLRFNNDSTDPFFDNNNNFDTVLNRNIITNKGSYSFNLSGSFGTGCRTWDGIKNYVFNQGVFDNEIVFEFIRIRNGVRSILETYSKTFRMPQEFGFTPDTLINFNYNIYDKTFESYFNFNYNTSRFDLNIGDEVYVRFRFIFNQEVSILHGPLVRSDAFIFFKSINENGTRTSFSNNVFKDDDFYLNATIDPKSGLPDKIKQIDYLKSILKKFNMVIKKDKNSFNKYIIEPVDYLLENAAIIDWTSKIDLDEDIEIKRMDEYLDKNILLEYKTDNNYYNEDYLNLYKLNYGSYRINNNEIRTDDDYKIETIFNGTPCYYIPDNNVVIPHLFNLKDDDSVNRVNLGIRILYRTIIDTSSVEYSNYTRIPNFSLSIVNPDDSTDNFFLSNDVGGDPIVYTAHHFSNPIDMDNSVDLNYGFQNIYYHHLNTTFPTQNNIYNRFWKKTIDIINNPNTQYVIFRVYLTADDVFNLDLDDKVKVMDNLYLINRILNWYDGETCEVEMIKII